KQADQPTANNCSGLVPMPGVPGTESFTSSRPSEERDAPPSRPPVVWALAVESTLTAGVLVLSGDIFVVFIIEFPLACFLAVDLWFVSFLSAVVHNVSFSVFHIRMAFVFQLIGLLQILFQGFRSSLIRKLTIQRRRLGAAE